MNAQQLKENIRIEILLSNEGFNPVKTQHGGKTLWYLSPLHSEKTASFKVDTSKNCFYDFAQGTGGSIIDFIMEFKKTDFKETIKYLNDNYDTIKKHSFKIEEVKNVQDTSVEIIAYKSIQNNYLINYIKSRNIDLDIALKYCKEVTYQITYPNNKKTFYAIGFKNDDDGFELRNKYFKGNGQIKTFTFFDNESKNTCIFEGFFDFLSFLTEFKKDELKYNYIILNSTSFIKKLDLSNPNITIQDIKNYKLYKIISSAEKIIHFFDNDNTGNDCKKIINLLHKNTEDKSFLYKNYNDYNQMLKNKSNINIKN